MRRYLIIWIFVVLWPRSFAVAQQSSPYYEQFQKRTEGQKPDPEEKSERTEKPKRFRFDVALGYLYGEAHTLKMADSNDAIPLDGRRIWKLQDALHISAGLALSWPRSRFRLGGGLPIVLTRAAMESWKWLYDNPPAGTPHKFPATAPSHYSIRDTENDLSFSAYVSFARNLLKGENAPNHSRLEIGVSFLYMTLGWKALRRKGLSFLNQDGELGHFALPSGPELRYRIHYLVPAFHAGFLTKWGIYGIEFLLHYSPSAIFLDKAQNLPNGAESEGFGFLGQMLYGSVRNSIALGKSWAVYLGLRGKVLFRTRLGTLTEKDDKGSSTKIPNGAGSEYFEISAFIGVALYF